MISPLAIISPKARIGKNVVIEPFATIKDDVVIGDNAYIHSNAIIYPDTTIGNNCQIFPGALIGIISQDLKYKGEKTTTIIGDHTIIREYVTIHKGTAERKTTKVGDHCLIMAYAHIAHDCIIGNNVILANSVGLSGHITIEDFVIIEGFSGLQQFLTIGAHSFIAAFSVLRKNVPPFIRVARNPLQYIGVNSIGLSRRGFTKEDIHHIEDIYRLIFVRGLNMTNALELIDQEIPDSLFKNQIVEFIKNSKDGIVKGI
jgi:UDP-N-acetylglucosamine acyltransferase